MKNSDYSQMQSRHALEVEETKSVALVVLAIVYAELFMHELTILPPILGLILAFVLFLVVGLMLRNYYRYKGSWWVAMSVLLTFIGVGLALRASSIDPFPGWSLPPFFPQPRQGFIALTHLVTDLSVIGIGIHQLARVFRTRSSARAIVAVSSLTGCCGTTASIITLVASAFLGTGVLHLGGPLVSIAAVMTTVLAAFAYSRAGRTTFSKEIAKPVNQNPSTGPKHER